MADFDNPLFDGLKNIFEKITSGQELSEEDTEGFKSNLIHGGLKITGFAFKSSRKNLTDAIVAAFGEGMSVEDIASTAGVDTEFVEAALVDTAAPEGAVPADDDAKKVNDEFDDIIRKETSNGGFGSHEDTSTDE